MEQKKNLKPALATLIVIVLVGIVTSIVFVVNDKNKDGAMNTGGTSQPSASATVDSTDTSTYKDGSYSATAMYMTPGGRESIALDVVIKDGAIADITMTSNPTSRDTAQYQSAFQNNFKSLVVGKKVNGLSLSRVAGSSLTSNGFNDALDSIRQDARA